MKVEKLVNIGEGFGVRSTASNHIDHPTFEVLVNLKDKINELIDAVNIHEQNNSVQMTDVMAEVFSLRGRVAELEKIFKDLAHTIYCCPIEKKGPEIKDCPFCAYKPVLFGEKSSHGVKCSNKGCCAHDIKAEFVNKDCAVKSWNTRA